MPFQFPDHKAGDIIHIFGLGEVTIEVPMGVPLPSAPAPVPKPSDLTPIYQSALYGHNHGNSFEQGNDASNIMSVAAYVNDHGISGLELRFFGRKVITTGKAKGERLEFHLNGGEYISGIQGTYNESQLTSLTLLTTDDRHWNFGTANSSNTGFSWIGSENQVAVGLGGFAGDMIHGLYVIYIDGDDDPLYDPTKDGTIEALPSRDINPPNIQDLYRKQDYDGLTTRRKAFSQNMDGLYKSLTAIVDKGTQNPWATVVDSTGTRLLIFYTGPSTAVYVYTDAPETTDSTNPSDTRNVIIGNTSGEKDWVISETISYTIAGISLATWSGVAHAFATFFTTYLLKTATRFIGSALDVLASSCISYGVLKNTARMFARTAAGLITIGTVWGLEVLGNVIGALIAWGVDALLSWIVKSCYLSIRIYNHDSALVEWTPNSYYGYNEQIPGAEWGIAKIPAVLTITGKPRWVPGVGLVTDKDYVGAYNSYSFENQNYGAGLAVAMAIQKGSGPDGLMCLYRIPEGPDNSMALTWGIQDAQTYLNGGHDTKVQHLAIDSPVQVLMITPALSGDPESHYSCSIFLGTFPPSPST